MHAEIHSTSPSHRGFQEWGIGHSLPHVLEESNVSGEQLKANAALLQKYFRITLGDIVKP